MQFTHDYFVILKEISDDIRKLGFDLREFGSNTFVLNGVPPDTNTGSAQQLIESILESYKNFNSNFKNNHRENLLKSVSYNMSVKVGKELDVKEMQQIANDLYKCNQPALSIWGKPTFVTIAPNEIERKFQQRFS